LSFCFINRNTFRQNLVSGDKSVLFPILQWLLEKIPEHKERAYLGRYLSKIDIPTEFLSDADIAEQYERVLKPALKYDTEQQVDHTNHRQGVQTTIQPSVNSKAADEKTAFALLASSYFALKDALVKTDAVAAAAHAEAFQAAVKAVDMNKLSHDEHTVWMKVMNKLASDATGITKNKDVAKQRVAFASLSNALYELLKVSKVDGPIYYQHCPMFSEGKGAHWLSKENAVKNPFFGAQMISCGSTVETLN